MDVGSKGAIAERVCRFGHAKLPVGINTQPLKGQQQLRLSVLLSQLRGKNVLLAFWSPGAPASLDDVSALKALQQRNPERLAILGICLLPAPSCADEHQEGHDHAHHHPESSAAGLEHGQMRD